MSLPEPFYTDDRVTIYHADCRDVLPLVEADVMVTDPPYGYGYTAHATRNGKRRHGFDASWVNERIAGDDDTSARDDALLHWSPRPALVFGTYRRPAPAGTRMALVWDKGDSAGRGDLSIPWKPNWELVYVLGQGFAGPRTSGVLRYWVASKQSMGRVHPTEKPVDLMRDLIAKCPPGVIVDPFAGSGSTLRAAKDLGRRAIGIEVDERYCRVAADRMRQEVLDFGTVA